MSELGGAEFPEWRMFTGTLQIYAPPLSKVREATPRAVG